MSLDQIMVLRDCMGDVGFEYADRDFYKQLTLESDHHSKQAPATALRLRLAKPSEPIELRFGDGNVGFETPEEVERCIRYLNASERHGGATKSWLVMGLQRLAEDARKHPDARISVN